MSLDRREFLGLSALGAGALGAGPMAFAGPDTTGIPEAERPLRLLILGGTGFTGPFQVAYARARGHEVTVFNRGRNTQVLPEDVEQLTGDRHLGELDALRGRRWDAVIDNPSTLPHWVHDMGKVLHEHTDRYLFISTVSVYDFEGLTHIDEDSPVLSYRDGDPLDIRAETFTPAIYGHMKAACEHEARRWYGERATIIRPTLIVGPRDGTDRFTYWPWRLARGGDIVAPGDGLDPVQIIDARDLAEWTVSMAESGAPGNYNAAGPRSRLTMAEQLFGIRAALSGDLSLQIHWLPAAFLAQHGVSAWSEMTTWFGPRDPVSEVGIERAVAAGLSFRALATTTADTLDWFRSQPAERQASLRAGLAADKEAAVLAAWQTRGRDER